MKKYITCTILAFFAAIAVSSAAPDKEAIIAKEKTAWQAFKDKKPDDFKKVVSANVVTVSADGMHTMQQELEAMSKTEMQSFDLSEFNVTFPDPKTAIITYKGKVEATSEGKNTSGTYNIGSVWRMTNGQWQGIFHSEAKEEPAAKSSG